MKETQMVMITNKLLSTGEVSRNWCLERFCSRLGSRICDLEKKGWEFKTEHRGGDYVYKVVKKPIENLEIYRPEVRLRMLNKQGQLL